MTTVVSLFSSSKEATQAMDALMASEFEDADVRVYRGDVPDERGEVKVAGMPAGSTAVAGAGAAAVVDSEITDLGDEELSDFFVDQVEKRGATLVVAEVDDDRADALEAFFQEHGGQTTEDE
jgi:hypothetical protein